jgi:hypothetical protein
MARSFDSFIKFLGSLVLLPIWVLASGVCFLLEIIKLIHQGKEKKRKKKPFLLQQFISL